MISQILRDKIDTTIESQINALEQSENYLKEIKERWDNKMPSLWYGI